MRCADSRRLDRCLDRFERQLPPAAARGVQRLRAPGARIVRVPSGVLLVVGGVFGFLPVLGFWMLPLGLLLLALDVPVLRRPSGRALVWGERRWTTWRRGRGGGE
jgi:hypothetical protein